MDQEKVRAVTMWQGPTFVKDIRCFIGFATLYHRFIHCHPIMALLKNKPCKLVFTPETKYAFITLKRAFTMAPILHHLDPEKPFVMLWRVVLWLFCHREKAKMHPMAYFSRKLTPAEWNYDIWEWELLAVKMVLEEWRHSIHPFLVLTDHKNLEYLKTAKCMNPRQARWILFFAHFNFTLVYHPGSKNTKADALSHQYPDTEILPEPEFWRKHCLTCFYGSLLTVTVCVLPLPKLPAAFELAEILFQHAFCTLGSGKVSWVTTDPNSHLRFRAVSWRR